MITIVGTMRLEIALVHSGFCTNAPVEVKKPSLHYEASVFDITTETLVYETSTVWVAPTIPEESIVFLVLSTLMMFYAELPYGVRNLIEQNLSEIQIRTFDPRNN